MANCKLRNALWLVTALVVTVTIVLQIWNSLGVVFLRITIIYMHAQSDLNVDRDALSKIHRTAVAILERFNAGSDISKPTPVLDTSSMALDLNLTIPHDIIAPIMKLPEGIRQELLCRFTNQLNELREQFLSVFRSTCSMARNANELDAIRQGLRNVYYRRCVSPLQLQLSRLPDISKHQRKNHSGKRTFNNVSAYGCSHVYAPPPQPQF